MLKKERRNFGRDSAVYAYWVKQIGDPDRDAERIAAISPITHTDRVKSPILLVHGDEDDIVPYEQSVAMKRALERSGRPTQLITLEDEGHSGWSDENQATVLSAIGQFLRANIGPGFKPGVETGR
jgi:dipeptidyl aminopeptidase/acylaminoacyl peptidase